MCAKSCHEKRWRRREKKLLDLSFGRQIRLRSNSHFILRAFSRSSSLAERSLFAIARKRARNCFIFHTRSQQTKHTASAHTYASRRNYEWISKLIIESRDTVKMSQIKIACGKITSIVVVVVAALLWTSPGLWREHERIPWFATTFIQSFRDSNGKSWGQSRYRGQSTKIVGQINLRWTHSIGRNIPRTMHLRISICEVDSNLWWCSNILVDW